jgi:hypothetical protein
MGDLDLLNDAVGRADVPGDVRAALLVALDRLTTRVAELEAIERRARELYARAPASVGGYAAREILGEA